MEFGSNQSPTGGANVTGRHGEAAIKELLATKGAAVVGYMPKIFRTPVI